MLFVRDCAGLQVPPDPTVPPPLIDVVQREPAEVSGHAGTQWLTWWRDALGLEIARHRQHEAPIVGREGARARLRELRALCDPPLFNALADRPELQAAAQDCIEGFRHWASPTRSRLTTGRPGELLEWALIRQVAEDVAFDRGVSLDKVQAKITVLPVEGTWWQRIAPGVVFCSTAAALDRNVAHALLRDAFDSQVRNASE